MFALLLFLAGLLLVVMRIWGRKLAALSVRLGCIKERKSFVATGSATSSLGLLFSLSSSSLFFVDELLLGGVGRSLLLVDLLDVHVGKLVLDLSLLGSKFVLVGLTATAESLLQVVVLGLLGSLGVAHHGLVVGRVALHELDELVAHLFFILGTHGELVADGLFLGLNLILLLFL